MPRRRIAVAAARPAGVPYCDVCLRPTPKAARTEAGVRHCRACYKLRFAPRACTTCGRTATVAKADRASTCRACRDAGRRCIRCDRPAPEAGRVLPGGVACRSCAYHYAQKRECPRCGGLAPRLSRITGEGLSVCDRCRRAVTCATCSRCGRHRRVGGRDDSQRPVCGPCGDGASHRCPDCGGDVPGPGGARCRPCSARRRGRARAVERGRELTPSWVAEVFDAFCAARLLGPSPHGGVVGEVDRAAAFFAAVGDAFASPAEVDATGLLSQIGAGRLRRAEAATAFLLERLDRAWDANIVATVAPPPVAAHAPSGTTAALLSDYQRHLEARGDGRTKPRTILAYMRAAGALMAFAEADGRASPSPRDVRRLIWRTPGVRASLGPFLSWLEATRGDAPALPGRGPVDRRKVERRRLADLGRLVAALDAAPRPSPSHAALLVSCLARTWGASLEAVLKVRIEQVRDGVDLALELDGLWTAVPARFAVALRAVASGRLSGFVFPGRSGIKPLSTDAVRHYVRAVIGLHRSRVGRL